ncbi:alpha-humulene synthase-like [Zingiber officinale]|uniref:alpha-humulene synthase-like n=1 Tax=Zingiber officinale TaxID=94328 RepID=UPI001C4BD2BC|nr:alpha-humulene synthase-like [Zingiber officinale]
MEKQSTTPVSSNEDIVIRKTSKYHPSIWGDYFIHHTTSPPLTEVLIRAEELKEQIKNLFRETSDILQIMNLIDAIQLLGLDYHFEKEIDAALSLISKHDAKNYELYETSLWFRLLRQHGFYVPPDVFNKFKNEEGNFMSTLNEDVKGLLSLYNAAYLRIHEEYILDEAILFTKNRLTLLLDKLKQPLVILVSLFLETPLCQRNKRLLARKYIPIYQEEERRNDAILEFAKLDFNLLQSLHQGELKKISIWWNDLALAKSLNFARDRIVECYYWILIVHFEPQYSRARLICTKVVSLMSLMDDIYDNYSTLQESQLLTEAIQRWEPQAIDEVPEYLKDFYLKLLRTFKEFENELESDETYRIPFLQDEIKALSRSYFIEAKWGIEKYVPTLEEHLSNSIVSTVYPVLICASYVGMDQVASKEVFEWVASFPKILKASSMIGRLMNDLTSHKRERQRDQHAASTIECYMKEFATDEKEAYKNLMEMVEDAWKDHNKECLNPTQVPRLIIEKIVNFSRVLEEVYKYTDIYTNSNTTMKDNIYMLLVESVLI